MTRSRKLVALAALGCLGLMAQETPQPNRMVWFAVFPEPLPSGDSELALEASNTQLRPDLQHSGDGRTSVNVDGEEWQLTGDYALDLGPGRFNVRARVVHRSGGIADQAIIGWHRFFGMPQGERDHSPRFRLDYHLERDGVVVADLQRPGLHLMDLDLAWVQAFGTLDGGWRWGLSLQAPTGQRSDFSGDGAWDGTLGFAGWKRWGSWRIHGQAEEVFLGVGHSNPYGVVLGRHSFPRAWAGAGYQGDGPGFWRGLGLDITFAYTDSPYAVGIRRVDKHGMEQHWAFTHRAFPRWRFVISEEGETYTAPDVKAALVYRF